MIVEAIYAQYPGRHREAHQYALIDMGKEDACGLVQKVLLELYEVFSDHDPHRGKVLHKTLAACRLVCRLWSWIVRPIRGGFVIRAQGKEWLSPAFPYYILQHTPVLPRNGAGLQDSHSGWSTENYTAALVDSHPKFLPELIRNMISGIYIYMEKKGPNDDYCWEDEKESVKRSALAACCLVSREWNRVFTPILYEDIFLGGGSSLSTRSLLHRTFRYTQPANKALVKTMTITLADDGSTANLLSICFSVPNLHRLILGFKEFNPAILHPDFAQHLYSLSKRCTIQIGKGSGDPVLISWKTLAGFMRRFKSTRGRFCTRCQGGK